MRTLFFIQLALITALLGVHGLVLQTDLYWRYLWLDVPMHLLGGLWAALISSWALCMWKKMMPLAGVFAGVLAIGIAWELFELAAGVPREANYALDTGIDIVMDLLGGAAGFFIARALTARDTMQNP